MHVDAAKLDVLRKFGEEVQVLQLENFLRPKQLVHLWRPVRRVDASVGDVRCVRCVLPFVAHDFASHVAALSVCK
jgi:hypothetical protein